MNAGGWEDPETAAFYERFCRRHTRYAEANAALIAKAELGPGMRVLDVGAGTGRTAEAALPSLGDDGRVVCFEPSAAMRAEVARRMARDRRVSWIDCLPARGRGDGERDQMFDRVLCGAGIWQMQPLRETLRTLAGLLRQGGALCFDIPALYLLEPDEPGGGTDPLLLALPELLLEPAKRDRAAGAGAPAIGEDHGADSSEPLDQASITAWLRDAGLRPRAWSFRIRFTQTAYADWLKIPLVGAPLLPALAPSARARRIEAALQAADASSWKWERWRGWTAFKDAAP